jgi:hypothetical protein
MINDRAIISRIIELHPLYDRETMPDLPSTIPGDDWGYTFINFTWDYLEEEFPGLKEAQFFRCYSKAANQTDLWQNLPPRRAS